MDRGMQPLSAQLVLAPAKELRCRRVHERQSSFAVERVETLHHGVHHRRAELRGRRALRDVKHYDPDTDHRSIDSDRVVTGQQVTIVLRSCPRALDLAIDHWLTGVEHAAIDRFHLRPHVGDGIGAVRPISSSGESPLIAEAVHILRPQQLVGVEVPFPTAGLGELSIRVSKPFRRTDARMVRWPAFGPASTCQQATAVAPFQLV
jgi:hypothetical protein